MAERAFNKARWLGSALLLLTTALAYHYDADFVEWNLNDNQFALDPTEYWGQWANHNYTPSPANWRFPFYTIMPDRFVNGDPSNDNINLTFFEHDSRSNQMRHGGDVVGIQTTLDYIQGLGIKGLYLAGSPFMNLPWTYDQYSPVDLSLLDQHLGTIDQWRDLIEDVHARGMYVILDNTFATLGDLLGFVGYVNTTAPFTTKEHQVQYKGDRLYNDFAFSNTYNQTCSYPRFWNETGFPVEAYVTQQLTGCYDSEFDQYGDTEAFGVFPDWRRELSKFASVQDRLREWHPPVRTKLENFYCMLIAQLDVDGFRYDKATQSTVDAMGDMNSAVRKCARRFGKTNFFLPGEITGGNDFGSIFLGRGRQPDMLPESLDLAVVMNNSSPQRYFIRESGSSALDAAAFHYTVYRTLTRFLGMDGNLEAGYDAPPNWVDMWNTFLLTNDFINTETGLFDPRHMYGVTNQDVFRWPAIHNGAQRQLLGHFVTTLLMPGIPLVLWGEEQAFYVLDNTADNYIFGRQPMSAATAWQDHGCYSIGSAQYYQWPIDAARHACHDDGVSYDHRDPSAVIRNTLKHMYYLRDLYPILNDGFFLQQLSNMTEYLLYPGSSGVPTETGLWSIMRSGFPGVQNLNTSSPSNTTVRSTAQNASSITQPEFVWLVLSNVNTTRNFEFDCSDSRNDRATRALIAPFDAGTRVKNLLPPYDEITLQQSSTSLGLGGSTKPNGCLHSLEMAAYDFRAYVPLSNWVLPQPTITRFTPGHDARILSNSSLEVLETVEISVEFSEQMDCDSVTTSLQFHAAVHQTQLPNVKDGSVVCTQTNDTTTPDWPGVVKGVWSWSAVLENVANGIFDIAIHNASNAAKNQYTNAVDHFMLRIGRRDNVMVFPRTANYSSSLLIMDDAGQLSVNHTADGAELWRYSTNWGSSFSDWMPYGGGVTPIELLDWVGTKRQGWSGEHVRVEYWSVLSASSDHVQEGDLDFDDGARRFPHLFLEGPFNNYGFDQGISNSFTLSDDNTWDYYFLTEWPAIAQVNVWGINPDGQPDQTYVMGDVDGDSVLDRLPPSSLSDAIINITVPPAYPSIGWLLQINDGTNSYTLTPGGHGRIQLALYILLWTLPVLGGSLSVWLYIRSFYGIKFEKFGLVERSHKTLSRVSLFKNDKSVKSYATSVTVSEYSGAYDPTTHERSIPLLDRVQQDVPRRKVLIATMEYDIEDWQVKVKIGGLGVMAQLMGKNLGHQDLIWVVPCVDGLDYPIDQVADPMNVKILGKVYRINVQYHVLNNITYVLLDAPTFRQQTKADPYPARMDDLDSAIYYSAWNQCISQAIERFQPDLYHINDYHGCLAPLYLLPTTIPVCLSLHNAEFQGLWPMRTQQESEEVSGLFNLPMYVVQQFVQFGEVFNLLHAGASYLRTYQGGYGAVGVSKKYGVRSHLRYPIFWGLKKVGQLPNPDPSDTGGWDGKLPKDEEISVDQEFESKRPELKQQAQEWAGLTVDPEAELFVFVGRWSTQKGIDLIADIFPSVLERYEHAQLICVGPVIDLYGRFAAAKLERMMSLYPGRVFSKPEFTQLPPYIFSGAEFALIPSRDEPFGLVAVEFGRKGALGVGARVGGLGQMPGWWYTIESMQTAHLLEQFKTAIEAAITSKQSTRATLRARSAKQRFPVAQWVADLETLQATSIKVHQKKLYDRAPSDSDRRGPKSHRHRKRRRQLHMKANGELTQTAIEEDGIEPPRRDLFRDDDGYDTGSESGTGTTTPQNELSTPQNELTDDYSEANSPEPRARGRERDVIAAIGSVDPQHTVPNDERRPSASQTSDGEERRIHFDEKNVHDVSSAASSRRTSTYIPTPLLSSNPSRPPSLHNVNTGSRSPNRAVFSPVRPIHGGSPLINASRPSSPFTSQHLSGGVVMGDRKDYKLQQVDPFFTDPNGDFYKDFEKRLETLKGSNSETRLCIGEYLQKSEKKFFGDLRNAKLGFHSRPESYRHSSAQTMATATTMVNEPGIHENAPFIDVAMNDNKSAETDSDAPQQYDHVSFLSKYMQVRLGDWPVYAFFLAFGQIIAANSYQIVLLTGQVGSSATEIYILSSIYLVATVLWWILFRFTGSRMVLSVPFAFYGLAFLLVGVARYAPAGTPRSWINHVGSGAYATASASGSFFFVLNFGDEGGAQVRSWVYRACVIQGTQQIYVTVLWFWGYHVNLTSTDGQVSSLRSFADTPAMTALGLAVAFFLWAVGGTLFFGLPKYYRQTPGNLPNLFSSIWRRKILVWFFITVLIQNFFLSSQYGRSWSFLFNSPHIAWWHTFLLVAFFFVVVWIAIMWGFSLLTHSHTWILPIFAIGLGAPRWAQIWWGTSNMALWLPWASGGYVGSALVSRALWLWLGVLDQLQGVGLGMILLSTLTRVHVLFTLVIAQVLGAATTAVARAGAPDRLNPSSVFPDITASLSLFKEAWFWVALVLNLGICIGYFKFFRKEQLTKP